MAKRLRQQVHISRETGEVTQSAEFLDDDGASFARRMAGLKAACLADAALPVLASWAHVVCDGCGSTAEVDYDHPVLPPGWTSSADGDLCPPCSAHLG